MSRRDTRLNGLNPLSYMGVNPQASPNLIENNRPPLPHDKQFNIGDFWINRVNLDLFMLVRLDGGKATWIRFATANNSITEYVTDAGTAVPFVSTMRWLGKETTKTTALGTAVSVYFLPLADGEMYISDGTTTAAGTISSPAGTMVVTYGPNSIDIIYSTVIGFHGDIGDAIKSGTVIKFLRSGNNMATHAIGNTCFVEMNSTPIISGTFTLSSYGGGIVTSNGVGLFDSQNGLDGQILIAGTGLAPKWDYITSLSGSLTINNTAYGIDIINPADQGIVTIDGDTGTATDVGDNIQILGSANITTAAAAETVTVSLNNSVTLPGTLTLYNLNAGVIQANGSREIFSSKGTDGQTLIGSNFTLPDWGNLYAVNSTITVTNGPHSIDLKATPLAGMLTVSGDIGIAAPTAGNISITGGYGMSSIAVGAPSNTVQVNLTPDPVVLGTFKILPNIDPIYIGVCVSSATKLVPSNTTTLPAQRQPTYIGGGTGPTWAHMTSPLGTITFTQTSSPRNMNIENNHSGEVDDGTTGALGTDDPGYSQSLGSSIPTQLYSVIRFDPGSHLTPPPPPYYHGPFIYTASISGKYNFQATYNFYEKWGPPADVEMKIMLTTSNRTYEIRRKEHLTIPTPIGTPPPINYLNGGMTFDVVCDLDAADTVTVFFLADNGAFSNPYQLTVGDGTFCSGFYIGR